MSHHLARQRMTRAVDLPSAAAKRLTTFLFLFVAIFGGGASAAQAADDPAYTKSDLCRAWSASSTNPEVTLSTGLVVSGSRLQKTGSSCYAPGAALTFISGSVDDADTAAPSGTASAGIMGAVTHAAVQEAAAGDELAEGSELFKGAIVKNLKVVLSGDLTYFKLSGEIQIKFSGGTTTRFLFNGKMFGLDKYDLNLYSPVGGTLIPNIGGTPLDFAGLLQLRGSHYTMNLTGSADSIIIGAGEKQLTVKNAALTATLKDAADGQRIELGVKGAITYGTHVAVQGDLTLDFDDAGLQSLAGSGALAVTIPAKGSSPDGSIAGNATISYTEDPAAFAVTFTGDVRFGEALIAGATGSLDDDAVSFTGNASYKNDQIDLSGAVDGVVYYGDDLTGLTIANRAGTQVPATKGDFLLKTASGKVVAKGLTVSGAAQVGFVGADKWVKAAGSVDTTFKVGDQPETNIKGSATIDWLAGSVPAVTFDGGITSGSTLVANAKGAVDGQKIDFSGDVTLSNPDLTIKGAVDGSVYYGADLTGLTVKNHAGDTVAAGKGDFVLKAASASITTKGFALTGAASLGRVGGDRWATGSGSVDATYNGTNLKGAASIDWVAGGIPAVTFDGAVTAPNFSATAKGAVDGNKLAFTGTGSLALTGLSVKGAIDGIVYYGSDLTGQKITNRAGTDVQATKGDFLIKSASADVVAKGFALKGAAQVGDVGGQLWAKGGGNVDLTYGATNLKGSATADWVAGQVPSVGFAGSLTSGTTTVANASGTFDGAKIALKGDAALTDPKLTLKGSVDGVLYYGDDLSGESVANRAGAQVQPKKGDYLLKSATGSVVVKGLTLNGSLSIASVAGDKWATASGDVDYAAGDTKIKGSASVNWVVGDTPSVAFTGSVSSGDTVVADAKGTIDGNKLTFTGGAALTNSSLTLKGAIDSAVVFYGSDLTGETVTNRAGTQVPATKGDLYIKSASATINTKGFAFTGAAQLGSVGGQKWVKGGGDVDLTLGATKLKGSASADWIVGQVPAVSFDGTVTSGDISAAAKGTLDGNKIILSGSASLTNSSLTLKGAIDGAVYYGNDLSGEQVTNHAGNKIAATKGDLVLKSASATVVTKGLSVSGAASIGFLASEKWVAGNGNIDTTFGNTSLKGSAAVDWVVGQVPTVSFAGSFSNGTTVVANASGLFDGKKIALKGDASLTDPSLTLKGAVDGTLYYGSDLSGEQVANHAGTKVQASKGDFVLKTASGAITVKNLALSGSVSIGSVGSEKWVTGGGSVDLTAGATAIKGTASVDWVVGQVPAVTFDGNLTSGDTTAAAKGTIDGNKLSFTGSAATKNANLTISGAADGVVYYGSDLSGQTITNHAGNQVQAQKGDLFIKSASADIAAKGFALKGAVSLGSVGSEKWAKGGGSVDLTYNGTSIKGSADVDWTYGQIPAVNFSGSVASGDTTVASASGTVDGKKIALKGQAQISNSNLSLKGAVDGVVYYGADLTGEQVANKSGTKVQATKGDFVLSSASADVVAKGLSLSGAVAIGSVGSQKWVTGGGSVNLTYGATKLAGSANVDWLVGSIPSVAFTGSLTNGTTVVANAAGVLDGKKIALKGSATATVGTTVLKGNVDGVFFYGSDLSGETITNRAGATVAASKGDYLLKDLSGSVTAKGLTLSGGITLGSVGGDTWASGGGTVNLTYSSPGQPDVVVKGSASLAADGGVAFDGTITYGTTTAQAKGTADGKKITFSGGVSSPTVSGNATGVLYYGSDLSGETIVNRAGKTVAATKGDFSLAVTDGRVTLKQLTATAKFSMKKVGTEWWINTDAQIKISQTYLTFTGDIDSAGNINLKGAGNVNFDGTTLAFSGTAQVSGTQLVIAGSVTVSNGLFSATLTGSITKPDMNTSGYVFVGSANFKFAGYQVAGATVRLSFGEGLTTSFSLKICILFVCPNATYKLYFNGGTIARAEMNAPIAWAAQFLAAGAIAMPGVHIDTKITGII